MEDSPLSESCSLTYDAADDSDHSADDIILVTGDGTNSISSCFQKHLTQVGMKLAKDDVQAHTWHFR